MPETKPAERAEVWITGIGLLSSLGEGLDAHWDALAQKRIHVDTESFEPYVVHPLAPISFDAQIPKKGDQRQMEAWQRIGTYAAGLALDSAGVKGNTDILSRMDMIVAAGGGERDLAVDSAILTREAQGENAPGFLNDRLLNDLRPTLFLAQLSNLLAGNIAIVHGVTGSSRTFMGEEAAGIDAVRIALARIAAGQSDIALVGAAHNGERKDMLMLYEFGDFNLKNCHAPVWARADTPGFALGSLGVFLVLESRKHAEARGAKPFARLTDVWADHARRQTPDDVRDVLRDLWGRLGDARPDAIISCATGAELPTAGERAFLREASSIPVRSTATAFGFAPETHMPLGIALGALSLSRGALYPANDSAGVELESDVAPRQIAVVAAGHWRGEGMALVERAS
jgi:3-oxoacyl-[acyl-carrier-protein] synthase II